MKRDYPDRPMVGVGAVIVQDGRALVVRRGTEPLRGEWSIPGGVLELGETLRQGAAREALEETGLTVEVGEVLEVFDRIVPDAQGKIRYHYVLIDFLCRPIGGEMRPGGDAAEARWIGGEELETFAIADPAAAVIRKALEKAC
jgi:ADP-ribose pyrophosphatase YjhB (NUDIX family)